MDRTLTRREVLTGCAVAASAGLAGCASGELTASATVADELNADGVTSVTVDAINGDITVQEEQRQSVAVDGQKRVPSEEDLEGVSLETRHEGDTLVLATDHQDQQDDGWLPSFGPNSEVNLDITVPESLSTVAVGTTNGDVEAEGLEATLDLDTTNGDIDVRGHRGVARIVTTNGEVSLGLETGADVTAESTNGDVDIGVPSSMAAQFSLQTTNGDLSVEGIDGLSVGDTDSLETVTGDGTHEVRCETTNGDITISS